MAAKFNNVNLQMQGIAENAVIAAREKFDISFDYTESSLQQLESILQQVDARYQQALVSATPLNIPIENTVRVWGSYLGEVIRRDFGGDWIVDQKAVYLKLGNKKLSPLGQVRSRIIDGPLFNIETYYKKIKSENQNNIKLDDNKTATDQKFSQTESVVYPLPHSSKWEYMFIQQNNYLITNGVYVVSTDGKREKKLQGNVEEAKIIELLNYYGASGWEAIGVGSRGMGTGFITTWTLKRSKPTQ
jgi:hypothetical protein